MQTDREWRIDTIRVVARYFAAVCKRGHTITSSLDSPDTVSDWALSSSRDRLYIQETNFCPSCSAPVIRACETCKTPILGGTKGAVARFQPKSFCHHCGSAYPWATREARIGQIYNLLDFEELDEADRLRAAEALSVLSLPETDADHEELVHAGETFKRLAPKAWETAKPVLMGLLSALLRERLGLPQ